MRTNFKYYKTFNNYLDLLLSFSKRFSKNSRSPLAIPAIDWAGIKGIRNTSIVPRFVQSSDQKHGRVSDHGV